MNVNDNAVDAKLKLSSPSKIMFDINVGWVDKKIRNGFIL